MSRVTSVGLFLIVTLVLTMMVLPASAAFQQIANQGTVFIGEEGLDITVAMNVTASESIVIAHYEPGQGFDETPITKTVDPTYFNVIDQIYKDNTGIWYFWDGSAVDKTRYIRVEKPTISVKLRSNDNDVTGKSVVRGTDIDFRVDTNMYEVISRPHETTDSYPFAIKVESPTGVVYTQLYIDNTNAKSLTSLDVDKSVWKWSEFAGGAWETNSKDGANSRYIAGKYRVSAECTVNDIDDNNDDATSNPVYVTIAADSLKLSVNKDTVTRGGQFTASIVGTPSTAYTLYVKSVGSYVGPKIIASQEGVVNIDDYEATVTTSSGGSRSVGFSTSQDTKARKWTIRVEEIDGDKYDEIYVTVQEGAISVSYDGSGVYYLGQEIKLTGTNTETDEVYFFITGPNLPSSGGSLNDPRDPVGTGGYVSATVRDDDTFEYKWNTESMSIDAGSYTVYAVSEKVNKDNLNDVQYDTVSINFRKPYITATITPSNVAAGDEVHITGNAGVETSQGVAIWIMGKNFFIHDSETVESDGTFDYELKSGDTEDLANGQYFVVVQHPMYDGVFDVYEGTGDNRGYVVGTYPVSDEENRKFRFSGAGSLQGSDAANALIDAIDDPAIDDNYAKSQFMVAQATINIDPIKTVKIGEKFTISGLTNLAVGNEILVEAVSASFGPTKKTSSGEFSGFSGSTEVVKGTNEWNKFSIEVDSSNFIKDEYLVTASAITVPVSGSASFQVLEFVPTTVPTTVVTTTVPTTKPTPVPTTIIPSIPTTIVTTIPTPEETPTVPQQSPGLGAFVALGGLGVVAYLVTKKPDNKN